MKATFSNGYYVADLHFCPDNSVNVCIHPAGSDSHFNGGDDFHFHFADWIAAVNYICSEYLFYSIERS